MATVKSWALPIGGAFLVLGLVAWAGSAARAHIAADAVRDLRLAHDDSVIAHAGHEAARVDTVLRRDTVTLTRWRVEYQPVHDTVLAHLTDTVRVKAYIAVADSTIHACTRVMQDCEQEAAQLRLALAAAEDGERQAKGAEPTILERHVGFVAAVAGVVGVYLGTRLK